MVVPPLKHQQNLTEPKSEEPPDPGKSEPEEVEPIKVGIVEPMLGDRNLLWVITSYWFRVSR